MSTRSELKENILASKLEGVLGWVLQNKNTVLVTVGALVAALLISSVFILRQKELNDVNQTRLAQAQSFIAQGQFAQASQILKDLQATALKPSLKNMVSYEQGLSALGAKDFDQAIHFFQETADKGGKSPLVPLALANLGHTYQQKKDFAGASAAYGRFMTEHGDHFMAPRIQLALGQTLALSNKWDEAKKALGQLIDLYPTSTWAENARSFLDKNKTR